MYDEVLNEPVELRICERGKCGDGNVMVNQLPLAHHSGAASLQRRNNHMGHSRWMEGALLLEISVQPAVIRTMNLPLDRSASQRTATSSINFPKHDPRDCTLFQLVVDPHGLHTAEAQAFQY